MGNSGSVSHHESVVKVLVRAVVIWRLDWGCRIHLPNSSLSQLWAGCLSSCRVDLSAGLLQCPYNRTADGSQTECPREQMGSCDIFYILPSFRNHFYNSLFVKSALCSMGRDCTKVWRPWVREHWSPVYTGPRHKLFSLPRMLHVVLSSPPKISLLWGSFSYYTSLLLPSPFFFFF